MRFRPFHLALIAFQVFWLNIVVPGHDRGAVSLPGTHASATGVLEGSCCAAAASSCDPKQDPHHPTRHADLSHCAICSFAARIATPPIVDFRLTEFQWLSIITPPRCQSPATIAFIETYLGRAPPVVG